MKTQLLESLGFSREELEAKVIDKLCSQVMQGHSYDEDGNAEVVDSQFARKLNERIEAKIKETIDKLAQKHVLPNVAGYIQKLTLEETNKWGEKKGIKLTFIEYLVKKCEEYMQEAVDYQGKPKGTDSYSWTAKQSRVAHMIHEHLHYSIETAMKQALANANSSIVNGIQETCKIKLQEVLKSLNVSVKTA